MYVYCYTVVWYWQYYSVHGKVQFAYFVQVIVATAISYGFDLQEKHDIIIVDHIPTG